MMAMGDLKPIQHQMGDISHAVSRWEWRYHTLGKEPPPLLTGTIFHNPHFLSIDCQIEATAKEGPRRLQLPLIV